ncbi:T9SS type B sorting domain-containing protein, partial [Maribacter sp.]|nr:T9SS type B sorting domain-containing protein [Maribacter sp.]
RISWGAVADLRGYYITVGTQLGLRDIADRVFVGNNNFYDPPEALPDNTIIYVKITLAFFGNRPVMACEAHKFTTGTRIPIPECTRLTNPFNEQTDVPLLAPLEWERVDNASAYQVTIGNSEASNDFLDATFDTNSTPNLVFQPNSRYYVTITPLNSSGEAIGCNAEFFSTILGCEPYIDPDTGELVDPRPENNIPDQIDICLNEGPLPFRSDDTAEGFRWYSIANSGAETLISETAEVLFSAGGMYRYENYNTIMQSGNLFECTTSKLVTVTASEIAIINDINITKQGNGSRIEVASDGIGDYEYALDDENGPYQDANNFDNLADGLYTVFVRDKNGCGIAQENVSILGYPKFFTPNADGQNDTWHLTSATNIEIVNGISIFDRYGKLLRILRPDELGWDGSYNGAPLPSSDYWFRAPLANGTEFKGHFSLKR